MVNNVTLIGRMGGEPEINMGTNGPRARFSVALNSFVNNEEKTTWVWVSAFGKAAESLAKYGEKGRQVYLEGRLDVYGDDNKLSVTVFRVKYLSPSKKAPGDTAKAPDSAPAEGYGAKTPEAKSDKKYGDFYGGSSENTPF